MVSKTARASSSPSKRNVKTIKNAANSGDRRRLLVALRNRIADDLDKGRIASRDLGALAKRLMDIAAEIERIDRGSSMDNPVADALDTDEETFDDESED